MLGGHSGKEKCFSPFVLCASACFDGCVHMPSFGAFVMSNEVIPSGEEVP